MSKARHRRAQRLEDFDLRRGVGDMILAAQDMADGELHIIHHEDMV
jgi:hypothetical protein